MKPEAGRELKRELIVNAARRMHRVTESYLAGRGDEEADFKVTKGLLEEIDKCKDALAPDELAIHKVLMTILKEDTPGEFMEKVFQYCCNYGLG